MMLFIPRFRILVSQIDVQQTLGFTIIYTLAESDFRGQDPPGPRKHPFFACRQSVVFIVALGKVPYYLSNFIDVACCNFFNIKLIPARPVCFFFDHRGTEYLKDPGYCNAVDDFPDTDFFYSIGGDTDLQSVR